jgi:RNA polymerase sigma-70 factor (ECF subfamily)
MHSTHEQFMHAFISAEPKMRIYALSCGLPVNEVDDLIQDAALVLWRRYGDYDPSRPFIPWALGVVFYLMQEARRDSRKAQRLLSPEVAKRLLDTCTSMSREVDARREALRRCVRRLSDQQRALLHSRYVEHLSLSGMAQRLKKNLSAVNMALHRIRMALLRCVEQEVRI